MAGERWLFTQEQLANTPSRKTGIENDKEIYYRQQAANFIQDMGQRLQVTQLCINTAIVYLHRFYMFHSFTKFHRNNMAEACLFLAAKVEEQPRKLEHIIKMAHTILHRDQGPLDTKSVAYLEHAQELVINENILLQTLGFELQVDHPHTHIVKTCQLIRAAKDLAQTSYFLATNSLHLTQMSLQNKPTFVACVCIHLACKWAQFEIPRSNEGKEWFFYVDKNMTSEILEDLTQNFLAILDKCPSKFKKKLMSKSAKDEDLLGMLSGPPEKKSKVEMTAHGSSDEGKLLVNNHEMRDKARVSVSSPLVKSEKHDMPAVNIKPEPQPKAGTSAAGPESSMRRVKTESYLTSLTPKDYFERKERERVERERIEKERQQLVEKEKRAIQKQAEKDKIQSEKALTQARQHTNIFEEMATSQVKTEPVISIDSSSVNPSQPKENHSVQRSHATGNYKDKYHEKEQGSRKLPFSVDVTKLREDQRKPSSYRHQERKGESVREPGSSGRHTHEPKHKSHVPHSEHRGMEHRSRVPQRPDPARFPVDEPRSKPQPTEPVAVNKVPVEVPKPAIDPEEGEIIDDDSPPVEESKDSKKAHSSHGYHHHHRERKSSGHRHHSPGAAVAAPVHQEREPAANAEGRVRRRSPRNGRPSKDEPPAGSQHERKVSGPRHDLHIPDVEKPLVKPMEFEIAATSRAISEASVLQRATPEPGEIIERSHKHGHHKSSHSKSHKKDKHRDREHQASSDGAGGLKIKLDLKGLGKVATPTKHNSPGAAIVDDDKKKEFKLKIKPLAMMHDIPDFPAGVKASHSSRDTPSGSKLKDSGVMKEPHVRLRDTPDQKHKEGSLSSKHKDQLSSHRDNTPNLKMKLKVPSSSTPSAGNGQTSAFKPDGRDSSDSLQSPGSRPIKLVLSKDNLGHYMPTPPGASTSSSHKHHRHSSGAVDKSSSRKRPFSPSEGNVQRHKLARNDSLTNLPPKIGGNDLLGDLSAGDSLTGSPHAAGQVATPSKESIEQSIGMLQQLIEQTQGQIIQRGTNPVSGSHRRRSGHSSTPTDKSIGDL